MVAETFGRLEGERPARTMTRAAANAQVELVDKNTEQVHFCLGTAGFSQDKQEKYALATIDSVLGGGMSSRLFQEIREKQGLAYAIGSYSASYQEAGLFAVYGGTSVENVKRVLEITRRECESIGRDSITDVELDRARNQIRGALVLGQESMSNRMSRLAKSELSLRQDRAPRRDNRRYNEGEQGRCGECGFAAIRAVEVRPGSHRAIREECESARRQPARGGQVGIFHHENTKGGKHEKGFESVQFVGSRNPPVLSGERKRAVFEGRSLAAVSTRPDGRAELARRADLQNRLSCFRIFVLS